MNNDNARHSECNEESCRRDPTEAHDDINNDNARHSECNEESCRKAVSKTVH